MKKFINVKVTVTAIIVALIQFASIAVFAEESSMFVNDVEFCKGEIYINNICVDNEKSVLFRDNEVVMIPLRKTFELLGAKVIWNENNEKTYIEYFGKNYVCKFITPNEFFPQNKYIVITDIAHENSDIDSDYIQLNSMCSFGAYQIINDRIYMYEEAFKRLLNEFGYILDIDLNRKNINITKKI